MSAIIDREKDCPFLLRVFSRNGGHNPMNTYTIDSVPSGELSLYTWQNATLEELAQLIQQVVPESQHEDARIAFRLVYLDSQRARFSYREIGRVVPSKPTDDHKKTLEECKLIIGDYLDVAVYIGPPSLPGRGGNNALGGGGNRLSNNRFNNGRSNNNNNNNNGRFGGRDNNRDNNRFGRQRRDRF